MQGAPPCCAATVTVRVCCRWPPPQVALHASELAQLLTAQSTGHGSEAHGCVSKSGGQVAPALSEMTDRQTLVVYSGHPLGLFPSHPDAPRAIITNGMVIPNYSTRAQLDKMYATCVSQYGQMTAGSYCYIGPQGIVHGTTISILSAARKWLGGRIEGVVYVSSGLGGMSGAQPKAARIAGCIGVTEIALSTGNAS